MRVLERVRQAFLDDPIGGEVDSAGEREGLAVDVQPGGQTGAADLVQQRVRPSRPGCGTNSTSSPSRRIAARRRRISASAVRPARSTLLSASRSSASVVGELVPDGAHLEHHHADGVGDDVVELAGDPRALLGHRDPGRSLALALGPDRAHLGCLGLLGALRAARSPATQAATNRSVMKMNELVGCGPGMF